MEGIAAFREQTETLLSAYRLRSRRHVTLVYDGGSRHSSQSSSGAIEIVYSGSASTADHWIIEHVKSLRARAGLCTVVSSDMEIRRYATAFGAHWMSSESFIGELEAMKIISPAAGTGPARRHENDNPMKTGSRPLGDEEVGRWLRLFNREK
jgi:hypothetical protein